MGPTNRSNPEKVYYFPLSEYVSRIKLTPSLLEHLEETNHNFDDYFKKLSKYSDYSVIYYWIDSLAKEMYASHAIEGHIISNSKMLNENIFFDKLSISHAQIKRLHQLATDGDNIEEYRNTNVRVSRFEKYGNETFEHIFWRGAEHEDVKSFMNDFISIYKSTSLSLINTNPFLKSALMHLLFVRIHPFKDGNGRTARMIHNIKFTDAINRIYGSRLKICPLNISQNILLNQKTYVNRIDDIYFDLQHDSNNEINQWFNFVLDMIDEQLYFSTNRIPKLEQSFYSIDTLRATDISKVSKNVEKMKIKYN